MLQSFCNLLSAKPPFHLRGVVIGKSVKSRPYDGPILVNQNSLTKKMGGAQSKQFFRALKEGDEQKALDLYDSTKELKEINPNQSYGRFYRSVTPLHLSAKRGFSKLFKTFMINGGLANQLDSRKQTVVHHICCASNGSDVNVDDIRADMLLFLINFCTAPETICPDKQISSQILDLNGQDKALNTPLHLAATSGLILCCKILLKHGAAVHLLNIAGQTAFTAAEISGHTEIVKLLEPKMVFMVTSEAALVVQKPSPLRMESYQGVQKQDIMEIKIGIVEHTASILDIPMSSAEQLLHHYSWSQQLLIDAWLDDPVKVCDTAKVKLPAARQTSLAVEVANIRQLSREEHICEICGDICLEVVANPACNHAFCKDCWQEYLRCKITEGKVVNIPCPGFGCDEYIVQEMVMKLMPSNLDSKFADFDIGAFIEANPNTRWCPYPGCERVVHLKLEQQQSLEAPDGSGNVAQANPTQRNVDCGIGHFFCWTCSEEAHDPCSCETWKLWKARIESIEGTEGTDPNSKLVDKVTSEAWIAKNSNPCPKCKMPIEKNDGCNHMTCSKCAHDFCWVCLGRWAIHGSRTGGYYQCNRFRAAKRAKDHLDALKQKAETESKKKNTRYFKHVYSRYTNHIHSLKLEEELQTKMPERMAAVIASALGNTPSVASANEGKFAKDAIRELVKARVVLRSSYALSYYVESDGNRDGLMKIVAPLEKAAESLAEMIARPHLCTPKDKIVLATIKCREVRRHLLPKAREYNVHHIELPPLEDPEDDSRSQLSISSNSDTESDYSDPPSLPSPLSPDEDVYLPRNELEVYLEENSESDEGSYDSYDSYY